MNIIASCRLNKILRVDALFSCDYSGASSDSRLYGYNCMLSVDNLYRDITTARIFKMYHSLS
jgi:hypothetical protein